jgi:hypothetical protein
VGRTVAQTGYWCGLAAFGYLRFIDGAEERFGEALADQQR